jgi:hypothetical protein
VMNRNETYNNIQSGDMASDVLCQCGGSLSSSIQSHKIR